MKTAILLPVLGLAALGLAACGPKTERATPVRKR